MNKIKFNDDNTNRGVEGWYAVDGEDLIIYCKPTNSKRDWLNHLKCWPVKLGRNKAHSGWKKDLDGVFSVLQEIRKKHPGKRLIYAGYSYGSPIMQGYSTWKSPDILVDIAGPKMFFNKVCISGKVVRVRNRFDPVPFLPPMYRAIEGSETVTILSGRERPFWQAHEDYDVDAVIEWARRNA